MATGRYSVTYAVSDNATALWCVICTDGQESKNEQIAVVSTKLEFGTIATPFVPPNPSIEIAKVRAANNYKPYVTGEVGSTNGTFITNHGFLPSKVLICPKSPTYGGDIIYSVTTFDEIGFKLAAGAGVPIYDKYEYIIFR